MMVREDVTLIIDNYARPHASFGKSISIYDFPTSLDVFLKMLKSFACYLIYSDVDTHNRLFARLSGIREGCTQGCSIHALCSYVCNSKNQK
jgi:hypothetical protein